MVGISSTMYTDSVMIGDPGGGIERGIGISSESEIFLQDQSQEGGGGG